MGFSLYALDNHREACSLYKLRIEQQRANESKVTSYQNKLNKLINVQIQQAAAAVNEVIRQINKTSFEINEARYSTKDPIILQAWEAVKEDWKNQSDYDRQRKMNFLESCSHFISTVYSFYEKLEREKGGGEGIEEQDGE